jgi:hypothetical protein
VDGGLRNDTAATTPVLYIYVSGDSNLAIPFAPWVKQSALADHRADRESQYREWRRQEKRERM